MPERVKIRFGTPEETLDPVREISKGSEAKPKQNARHEKPFTKERRPQSHAKPVSAANGATGRLRERANALLKVRERLPIWSQAETIRKCIREDKDVLLLEGQTGSGKSTQVPQFLVDEPWAKRRKVQIPSTGETVSVGGCIAITEPRKVAAVSLARRVAEEVGTPLGSSSPASTVGYHVRFDHSVSSNTRIKFLTEGMLLQEMLRDPWLRQYSAVIVDEVHERNVNVDLILGFLRNIVSGKKEGRGGLPLKVVVMSATADLIALNDFFVDGFRNAEDEEKLDPTEDKLAICRIQGRQYPVKVLYSPSPNNDIIDAALRLVFQINYKEPLPGDILVFLTGQETVEALEKLINDYAPGLKKDIPKLLPLPLFAALPQAAQQRVFQSAPHRTRKVIIATNIAETSVTVPGVRHVIDCGKSKIKQFRTQIGLESLLCKPISQSAATQRTGRAGREAPGTCYRLYTEAAYKDLDEATTPEILRCDVAQALLTMKARGVQKPWSFPLLDAPPLSSLSKGLEQLQQLSILTAAGEITGSGQQIAKLPLSASLGRTLLTASEPEFDCLAEVIDIISCLSVEAVFLQPTGEEGRDRAANARASLIRREGDHLTLLAAMQAYTMEQTDRKAWCENHLISHRAMRGAWDIRKQLRTQAGSLGLDANFEAKSSDAPSPVVNSEERASKVLQCILRGFISRTALLCPDGAYRTCEGKHDIAIHPASVLFGKKVEAIVYNEFVYTNRSYARNVSAIHSGWIEEVMAS